MKNAWLSANLDNLAPCFRAGCPVVATTRHYPLLAVLAAVFQGSLSGACWLLEYVVINNQASELNHTTAEKKGALYSRKSYVFMAGNVSTVALRIIRRA
jgi:hypothetical protein